MAAYNSIHRQQLFHWLGAHIDARAAKNALTDPLRDGYVACLRDALEHGLWVKTPRDPDFLGQGDLIKVHRPITCFTEWTLGQSQPHTTRYGRLAFGFPKKFVLARGGQPITYVRDQRSSDPYTAALKALARAFQSDPPVLRLPAKKWAELRAHFDYLSHFNKKIRRPAPARPRVPAAKAGAPIPGASLKSNRGAKAPDAFVRQFGRTLHYLEEREWRIVYDRSIEHYFDRGPGKPEYYLPFAPGSDLFTVVLPDNRTLNLAMSDARIRRKLFPAAAPHVTLLSLQDIGTF